MNALRSFSDLKKLSLLSSAHGHVRMKISFGKSSSIFIRFTSPYSLRQENEQYCFLFQRNSASGH